MRRAARGDLADAVDEALPRLGVRGLERVVVALDAGPDDHLRAERAGEVGGAQRLVERLGADRVVGRGEPALAEARVEVRAGADRVDAVAVERLADLVEVLLAELLRVVELVVVHEVAEPLDGAAHLLRGRLVAVLGLVAAGHEAGDHRAQRPDPQAHLQVAHRVSVLQVDHVMGGRAARARPRARAARRGCRAGPPARRRRPAARRARRRRSPRSGRARSHASPLAVRVDEPAGRRRARRSPRRPGAGRPASCGSCGSRPSHANPPRRPLTDRRGPAIGASTPIDRCERAPPACSSATNASSSTCAPGPPRADLGVHAHRAAEQQHAPGRRGAGRGRAAARRRPRRRPARASRRRPRGGSARSATRSARRRRARPRATSRCAVRKSPSQRRFWKTVTRAAGGEHLLGLRGARRERLVDDDRHAAPDRLERERRVRVVRRRDDDEVGVPRLVGRRRRPSRPGTRRAPARRARRSTSRSSRARARRPRAMSGAWKTSPGEAEAESATLIASSASSTRAWPTASSRPSSGGRPSRAAAATSSSSRR